VNQLSSGAAFWGFAVESKQPSSAMQVVSMKKSELSSGTTHLVLRHLLQDSRDKAVIDRDELDLRPPEPAGAGRGGSHCRP
jgi:hypothetical protein